jgi:anti-anti-sigma factor
MSRTCRHISESDQPKTPPRPKASPLTWLALLAAGWRATPAWTTPPLGISALAASAANSVGGLGLVLVDELSDCWGVTCDEAGAARVWWNLRRSIPITRFMTDPPEIDPPPLLFRVDAKVEGRVVTVAVFGDIDLSTIGTLETRTRELLEERELSHLILDLREATFMDSNGIHLLLALHADARRDDYRFAIVRGPKEVHRVLKVVGVEHQLLIVDDPAQALTGTD